MFSLADGIPSFCIFCNVQSFFSGKWPHIKFPRITANLELSEERGI